MVEFLSLSNDAFGMEITDATVRVMKLARRGGKVVAAAAGAAPIAAGAVKDDDVKNEDKLAAAIRAALANSAGEKIRTRRAVVSLPENKAFLQVIQMPRLRDQDLRAAVTFEAENYIPLPLEKVYLDFETVPEIPPHGAQTSCEVLIAALPRQTIDSRLNAIVKAGLVPVVMELESQAAARALFGGRIAPSPAIILQVGDEKTNLIVYSDNSIRFTFSIPMSNRFFLETISKSVGADAHEAQNLKTKCGIEEFARLAQGETDGQSPATDNRRKIFEALVPGLVDFTQQAKKCLQYYQTHESGRGTSIDAIEKILMCGSGSDLKGLDEFIALKLNMRVERAAPLVDTKKLEKKAGNSALFQNPGDFVIAAGLAMRGLEGDEVTLKNIPGTAPAAERHTVRRLRAKIK